MVVSWLADKAFAGPGGVEPVAGEFTDPFERPRILRRPASFDSREERRASARFDPVSDDVLRRYRSYAAELATLAPEPSRPTGPRMHCISPMAV